MLFVLCVFFRGDLSENREERRSLRKAIHNRDPGRLCSMVLAGVDVNQVISEVFRDTPLSYAVKCGFLEVVETLVRMPQCMLDLNDRGHHSPLDEAVRAWLLGAGAPSEVRQLLSKRYRILKCLLEAGASNLTPSSLDMLVFSTLNMVSGHLLINKLVNLFCDKATQSVLCVLFATLAAYKNTTPYLVKLAHHGAHPTSYLYRHPPRPTLPPDSAMTLLKLSNHPALLTRVETHACSSLARIEAEWCHYRPFVKLLTLCGHRLQASLLQHLYRHHAKMYRWIYRYRRGPPPLLHICRTVVRTNLTPNILTACSRLYLPQPLLSFLLYEEFFSQVS